MTRPALSLPEAQQRSREDALASPAPPPAVALPRMAAWDVHAAQRADVPPSLLDALRAAALAAYAEWGAEPENTDSPDVAEQFDAVLAAVWTALTEHAPCPVRLPPGSPARVLLDRARSAFLARMESLPAPPDGGALLRVLRSLERVATELDRDPAHRFAGRLEGPQGLELLVEVAHDLRSPLASVLFLAETLRKGQSGPVSPVQERQLGLIYSAAFGLSALASDVIELARGGDRLVERNPVPFAVSSILRAVHDIVQPMAEEKGITVRLSGPDADFRIGHPAALHRVLLNLTTNALKFTAEGFVEVTGEQVSRTRVQFAVRDTGRGIPPDVIASLFETFRRRAKPGDYAFSSAGLGLVICRKLVAAMGGELAVETAPDYGTRFHFVLDLPLTSRV
ncbi:MAG TPA: HAMP domain-containing sensor histidine kinase [Gemmatimonadaceae bacterium]|nr:HAMP domain-containing sensor histidine kinase [Gemmatimonadaceae bacterium]